MIFTRLIPGRSIAATLAMAMFAQAGVDAVAADATADQRRFSGMWRVVPSEHTMFLLGIDLPYKPETQDIAAERLELFKTGKTAASAHLTCRPTGVHTVTAPKGPVLIQQTPGKLVFISQEDREARHVYLNEEHPRDLTPSYSGHSVGRWEGDTLVIDTIGFNGKGQLDEVGNPHSDQLHVVERLTKSKDGNTLRAEYTFTDPVFYTAPFTKVREWKHVPGVRLLDYDCAENPREDEFSKMTFQSDWFKPVCVRRVENGIASDKVVCKTVSAPAPVTAAPSAAALFRSSDARLHANKQTVYHIINDLILGGRWEAAEKYLAQDYIEHNPNAPSGLEGQRAYFLKEAANRPPSFPTSLEGTVVAVTAEGDRVVVTSLRHRRHPDDPTKTYTIAWFDMWRMENGKAVEHWDADSRDPAGR